MRASTTESLHDGKQSVSEDLLLIVDTNNVVVRAHAGMASAGLTASDGTPTGGIFGAIRTLNMYIQRLKPTHIVCFWDFGRSTFRTQIRADYKGDRPKPNYLEPGELQKTFQLFEEYLRLANIQQYKEENVEADDLIASCVTDLRDQTPITILSADHDLRQLVRQPDPYPVTVIKPSMSSTKPKESTYTYDSVVEEYKLPPHRLAELWAIEGDIGDNVRGVPGYGPVKALKALQAWGHLSNAIANEAKFAGFERQIEENYRLIRLPSEVIPQKSHSLRSLKFTDVYSYSPELRVFFERLELQTMLMKFDAGTLFTQEEGLRTGFSNL